MAGGQGAASSRHRFGAGSAPAGHRSFRRAFHAACPSGQAAALGRTLGNRPRDADAVETAEQWRGPEGTAGTMKLRRARSIFFERKLREETEGRRPGARGLWARPAAPADGFHPRARRQIGPRQRSSSRGPGGRRSGADAGKRRRAPGPGWRDDAPPCASTRGGRRDDAPSCGLRWPGARRRIWPG